MLDDSGMTPNTGDDDYYLMKIQLIRKKPHQDHICMPNHSVTLREMCRR